MKLRKPKFWDKPSLLSFLLYPLSLIYLLFLGLKKAFLQNQFSSPNYMWEIYTLVVLGKLHCQF